jgi:cytochrome P450
MLMLLYTPRVVTVALALKPYPLLGHLPFWAGDPLALLESHARDGEVFELRLGVRAFVGHSAAWNKFVLSDLETFKSAGSFTRWIPYLSGGVILTDAPRHKPRRAELNPGFHAHALTHLRRVIRDALEESLPTGEFDARHWAARASVTALNAAFFSLEFDQGLLEAFLEPLHHSFPAPLVPRPALFRRVNREFERLIQARAMNRRHDLLSYLLRFENPLEEARVSLAAGFDTTAHTLAWTAWHVARAPRWRENIDWAIRETLRLYPPGYVGSRRAARATTFQDRAIPKGSLVLYSPYLTHRDGANHARSLEWNPQRFEHAPKAWTYLPFGGGERICLGMHLANLVLEVALEALFAKQVRAVRGDPTPRPGLTLAPKYELRLERGLTSAQLR